VSVQLYFDEGDSQAAFRVIHKNSHFDSPAIVSCAG
jgi:hypothetical protein